ncbi:uncharacterized protein LOC124919761 [Impatiens glandulifera]|uniref:uncharacterized protein LOC124919761 n=1 Tax=Impatiens glandulifera TaxID=253017 RepID=UPI001FB0F95B|nr:uncharacterized protein LOC124919761 [Impatiens glandulifera]
MMGRRKVTNNAKSGGKSQRKLKLVTPMDEVVGSRVKSKRKFKSITSMNEPISGVKTRRKITSLSSIYEAVSGNKNNQILNPHASVDEADPSGKPKRQLRSSMDQSVPCEKSKTKSNPHASIDREIPNDNTRINVNTGLESFDWGRGNVLETIGLSSESTEQTPPIATSESDNPNHILDEVTPSIRRSFRVRGKNKCRSLEKLNTGEKLSVTFYRDRATGLNHKIFTRYLGMIVRDTNICPVRVSDWNKIDEDALNRMWTAVTDKFINEHMELYREPTLKHMHVLWKNWRAEMNAKYVKPCGNQSEVFQNVPNDMEKGDWEWLVKEYYLSEKYQELSKRNSKNRQSKSIPPHRTGSKPFRHIEYEMGGKDGNPPNIASMFHETRKSGEGIVDLEAIEKYNEICDLMEMEPSLSNMEVIEKCFGTQKHDHVIGYGGGVKPKDMRGPVVVTPSKVEELLYQENKVLKTTITNLVGENETLKASVNHLADEVKLIKEMMLQNLASSSSITTQPPITLMPGEKQGANSLLMLRGCRTKRRSKRLR